ncbi:pyridoxal phosphate-dependent decarboxylase family protein [Knoellia aerolata]|uniref:2,4-diaminobutyrate decarboxylase n=1 Tax=Knoellia aerolata DSM 18566 TaxID=1385519 RepID=A0A0A0K0U4_9MICO|nr:aspartate aminotransferase family protein [Knoellia aerolata]KGN41411.1 2,4-diaminobutyrate decarboxylase [Knoellia aerolata DSM 18566]
MVRTPPEDIARLWQQASRSAIAFRQGVADRAAAPQEDYAASLRSFVATLPESGSDPAEVLDDLVRRADRGLMTPTGPRFFGWVIGGSHPVGVAADWLTSAWGQNAGNHQAAPAASAVETVAAGWLLELLDLPREASVGFVTGATVANVTALAAARGEVLRRVGWDVERDGLFGAPEVTVVIGAEAHTTVYAALQLLGLGRDRVTRLPVDDHGRVFVRPALEVLSGVGQPAIVVLQAGHVNTGAFDDFGVLVPAARAAGAWVHVDGAFGLWARVSEQTSHLAVGLEGADSWAVDGHKWLQTPYDSGFVVVRDEQAHRRAMTIAASYLPTPGEGERDPSHYVPELSRRARGFAVWAMIRTLGRDGIREVVERHCACARLVAGRLRTEPGIAVLNDVDLNQVLVRFGADRPDDEGDRVTRATIERIRADGVCFTGGATWLGREVMRLSVVGFETDADEAARSAEAIVTAYRSVLAAGSAHGS